MTILIGETELIALDYGAQLLSSGGGGDTYLGRRLAEIYISEYGPVELCQIDELHDQDPVCATGLVGSVVAFSEKPGGSEVFVRALDSLNRYKGEQAVAVFPYECVGINAFLPLVLAASQRLRLIDVDFMGRAFHSLAQATPTLTQQHLAPAVVAGTNGSIVLLDGIINQQLENSIRPMLKDFGGWGAFAAFHESSSMTRSVAIQGSYTRAMELGRDYLDALNDSKGDVASALNQLSELGSLRLLAHGYVSDVYWTTRSRGEQHAPAAIFTVQPTDGGFGSNPGHSNIRIDAMHEFLIVSQGGEILAESPQIITVVDSTTSRAVQTSSLRKGMRVEIVSLKPPAEWTSDVGVSLTNAKFHGINVPRTNGVS